MEFICQIPLLLSAIFKERFLTRKFSIFFIRLEIVSRRKLFSPKMKFCLMVIFYTLYSFSIAIAAASPRYWDGECRAVLYDETHSQSTHIAPQPRKCYNVDHIDFDVRSIDFNGCAYEYITCVTWFSGKDCHEEENYYCGFDDEELTSVYKGNSKIRSIKIW